VSIEISSLPIEYEGAPATLAFARDTTERKLMQAALAFADRMTTLGTLAAGVAHEINNPLAYVAINVETLARQLPPSTDGSVDSALAAARDGLAHVAKIVRDLRTFSTPRSEIRWPVAVEEVLESAVNVAMHEIRGRVRLVRDYGAVPPLKTDPARLGQVLLNLLFNAVQSFEVVDETVNTVWLGIASSAPANVTITVADNGPGIAREHLHRIFEPFFTTKGTGTGLGLAICQALVSALGGTLEVESLPGTGTKFTVCFAVTS
jgi:signal transduction histidine kinase